MSVPPNAAPELLPSVEASREQHSLEVVLAASARCRRWSAGLEHFKECCGRIRTLGEAAQQRDSATTAATVFQELH